MMKNKLSLFLSSCFCLLIGLCCIVSCSGKPKVLSGPMQGHTTSSSFKLWFLLKDFEEGLCMISSKGKTVQSVKFNSDTLFGLDREFPITLNFENLKPNSTFDISLFLDGLEFPLSKRNASTFTDEVQSDFSFLLGSCVITPKWFLPSFILKSWWKIFKPMEDEQANFMLWLGDNFYYLGFDTRTEENMFRKHSSVKRINEIRHFLLSKANYSIWDDHDFGPNNSNRNFERREYSMTLHNAFWANPDVTVKEKRTYYKFQHSDAEFFMTDCRYYRTDSTASNRTLLGKKQFQWLCDNLKSSEAEFKFISMGIQVVNEDNIHENYIDFPEERKQLFDFIKEEKIEGVIFLSGDMHFTEFYKYNLEGAYPLHELTCSPLANKVYNTPVKSNALNESNSLIMKRNYGKITIKTYDSQRICIFEVFDVGGEKLWSYQLDSDSLKFK